MRIPNFLLLTLTVAMAAGQDLSPPCIKKGYDTNPGPYSCELAGKDGAPDINAEILARCTCSSFSVNRHGSLYQCLRDCPVDEQTTYLQGWTNTTYVCTELFPSVDADEVEKGRTDPDLRNEEGGSKDTEDQGLLDGASPTTNDDSSQTTSSQSADETDAAPPTLIGPLPMILGIGALALAVNM